MAKFDWQTEEDNWPDDLPAPTPPRPPRRWLPWAIVGVFLFLLVIVLGFRQLNQRLESVSDSEESNVLSSHGIIEEAQLSFDPELFLNVLSGRDENWVVAQQLNLRYGLLYGRDPWNLFLLDTPAQVVEIVQNPALDSTEMLVNRQYAINVGNGLTETIILQQAVVYRRGETRWLLAPPSDEFWGEWEYKSSRRLTVAYPARDQEIVQRLIFDLEEQLGEMCSQISALNCPPNLFVTLRFDTNPDTLWLPGRRHSFITTPLDQLRLPTPTLVGKPIDEAGYQALFRGYAGQLLAVVMTELVGWECCLHAAEHFEFLNTSLAETGVYATYPLAYPYPTPIVFTEAALTTNQPPAPAATLPPPPPTATPLPEPTRTPPPVKEDTPTPSIAPPQPREKELVICLSEEPNSLFLYDDLNASARLIHQAIYENLSTSLNYRVEPQGLSAIPSAHNEQMQTVSVTVQTGDTVLDAFGQIATLETGITLQSADGELVVFDGSPVLLHQTSIAFEFQPMLWSDGNLLTAADSVFSYEVARALVTLDKLDPFLLTESYVAPENMVARWTGIPGFVPPDPLVWLWPPLPQHQLSSVVIEELPERAIATQRPLGTGPFRMVEWLEGEQITLEKNSNYYRLRDGFPHLDKVIFRFLPNENMLIAELLANRCDLIPPEAVSQTMWFLNTGGDTELMVKYAAPSITYTALHFNINPDQSAVTGEPRPVWLADETVRQAVAMCLDQSQIINESVTGLEANIQPLIVYTAVDHPLLPKNLTPWPHDPVAANALLDASGYLDSDGDNLREYPQSNLPIQLILYAGQGSAIQNKIAPIIVENLQQCGVSTTILGLDVEDPWQRLQTGQIDLLLQTDIMSVTPTCIDFIPDYISYPHGYWGPKQKSRSLWEDEIFSAACRQAAGSLPGSENYTTAHQAAMVRFAEALPMLPLFQQPQVAFSRPTVVDYALEGTGTTLSLWNLFSIDLEE